jgi:hypothetical protein
MQRAARPWSFVRACPSLILQPLGDGTAGRQFAFDLEEASNLAHYSNP